MNDCNKCVWARRDGGCNSWDCTFIDQDEAANAYTDRLFKRVKESPVMVLREPERKTGRWIVKPAPDKYHAGEVMCPFCKTELIADPDEYRYCPGCGARLEG